MEYYDIVSYGQKRCGSFFTILLLIRINAVE